MNSFRCFLPLGASEHSAILQRIHSFAIVLRRVDPASSYRNATMTIIVARASSSGSSPIADDIGRAITLRREFKRQSREGYFRVLSNRYGTYEEGVRWLGAESLSKSDILFSIDYVMAGVARPHPVDEKNVALLAE